MALDNSNTLGVINNSPRARTIRHFEEWMMDGRLMAGSRIPSEMNLAKKLKVSRTTIRLAFVDLQRRGLITLKDRHWFVEKSVNTRKTIFSDSIAVISEPMSPHEFSDRIRSTWHIDFVQTGAIHAIHAAGYDALAVHPKRIEGDLLQRLISQRPSGAIVLCGIKEDRSGDRIARALIEGNIPFVIYGDMGLATENPALVAEIDAVSSDHEAGAYALTHWLIENGRTRILRFWQLNSPPQETQPWLQERNRGYERAMRDAGLEPLPAVQLFDPAYHNFDNTEEDFKFRARTMAGFLVEHLKGPNRIDAIMAPSDGLVGHLTAALRVHEIEPNKDVWIVGYDNMWDDMESKRWEPLGPVATIDKKNLEIGSQLMSLLNQRIEGKLFERGERRIVTPELIIRPSAFPDSGQRAAITIPIAPVSAGR